MSRCPRTLPVFRLVGFGNLLANMTTLMRGIPAFFKPNFAALHGTHASVGAEAAGYYSTEPLRETFDSLVDFASLATARRG